MRRWDANSPIAIRYVAVTATQGPAGQRNAAWRITRGAIVAFTDDDCIPDPGWLREGLAALGPETDALSGCVVVPHGDKPTDHERDTAGLATAEFVTANCFCRRAALAAVGGFDERFTMAWREDSDLQFTFLERGLRIDHAVRARLSFTPFGQRMGNQPVSTAQKAPSTLYCCGNTVSFIGSEFHRFRAFIMPPRRLQCAYLVSWSIGHRVFAVGALAVWLLSVGWFCGRRLAGASKEPGHIAEMVITSAPHTVYRHLLADSRQCTLWRFAILIAESVASEGEAAAVCRNLASWRATNLLLMECGCLQLHRYGTLKIASLEQTLRRHTRVQPIFRPYSSHPHTSNV